MFSALEFSKWLGISSPLCILLGFGLSTWLKSRLNNSIAFEYARKLEDVKSQEQAKLKAALIAELLAEWLAHPEDYYKLRQLTFEAFLWLPDNIAKELSKTLTHQPDSVFVTEIVVMVRRHLIGEGTTITAPDVTMWLKK